MYQYELVLLLALFGLFSLWRLIHAIRVVNYEARAQQTEKRPSPEESFGLAFLVFMVLAPFVSPYW